MDFMEGHIPLQNGLKLYFRQVGTGRETVVIPAATWLAEDLEMLAQGRKIIFYDQRGRGRSDRDPDPANIWSEYEVEDLEAVRRHFNLTQFSILGWSYMGSLIPLYAAAYPDHVTRLVLMCPSPPRSEAPYADAEARTRKENERLDPDGLARLEGMKAAGLDIEDPETFCRVSHQVLTPRQMGKPETLARMRSDPCAWPNEWPAHKAEHMRLHVPETSWQYDRRAKARKVRAPVLVVHGSEDLIPQAASTEWAAILPTARLLVIRGSGHFPHLEAPTLFFEAAHGFLGGDWPPAAKKVANREDE